MKIYTKKGDKGETDLIGGKRVSKSDPRIMAYGLIDELNSNIGLTISFLNSKNTTLFPDLIDLLIKIQNDLFAIGSDLADPRYPMENQYAISRTDEKMASYLEFAIDELDKELLPIKFFILPGGSIESSFLHVTRSVARRTETAVAALSKSQTINPAILIYLNRLSDLLFVAARLANKRNGIEDIFWESSRHQKT
ncbi:MAG: cob(I)yrinic acid a,c-diamide adenosyltransferase [Nitrososphaeraceae archaeon]|nr:cob(I)yrinic acid a,c-diamide adenosyltransferase [Nitrososphaeraceae archaeon]MBV9667756.1 cob(I)yrinic acid a,c-diamide adenosyltransferase [Nitrososphaeraceae archaeon]